MTLLQFCNDLSSQALVELNGFSHSGSHLPVPAIIFFGAPHRGLQTEALETIVKLRPSEDLVKELQIQSPTLRELNDKFRHVAENIDILSCYETIPTRTVTMVYGYFRSLFCVADDRISYPMAN